MNRISHETNFSPDAMPDFFQDELDAQLLSAAQLLQGIMAERLERAVRSHPAGRTRLLEHAGASLELVQPQQ
jgi:hypothetical protein